LASKRDIRLFYLVTVAYWCSLYFYVPILGPYVEHLGGSLQMVGLVIGSYGVSQLVLRIPLGVFSDTIQKRRIFINGGLLLALISAVVMGLAPSPGLVLLGRALSGAGAATWVIFTVLFSSYFPPQEAPKAMGVIMFCTTMGQMIATTTGGFLADAFGWQAPFFLAGLVALGGLLFSMGIEEGVPQQKREPLQMGELLQVGRDRQLLLVSFLGVLYQGLTYASIYGFNPMYAVSIGATKSQLSLLALASTVPAAFASLKSGDLTARFGERRVLLTSFGLFTLFTVVIPFVTELPMFYFTQAIANLGRGCIFPILLSLAIIDVPDEKRATAMGFFQSIYALGMFLGPVLAGFIGEHLSLKSSFISIGLLGVVAMFFVHRQIKVQSPGSPGATEEIPSPGRSSLGK
jgi:predicted MFS family arabinose efflux permease